MIPYFEFKTFYIVPLPLHAWGLMVALGILAGAALNAWLAKKRGQDPAIFWDLAVWVTIGAMILARIFHIVFYEPAYFLANPLELIMVWHGGLSIMGGFVGAVIGAIWFLKRKHVDVWAHVNTGIFGLPLGLAIGRLGCFLIHDHPGTATHFFLGVKHPDGIVRHDLGLYESILGAVIAIVFFIMHHKKARPEAYVPTFLILYGTARFLLDFLRMIDARYLGLTPAQYLSVAMVGFGIYLSLRAKRSNLQSLTAND